MCVAAIIFEPVKKEYLELMEQDNPHGAGIAWQVGEDIVFSRGLTAAQIFQMQEKNMMSYPYLLHFRWATHGGVVPQLTHPFPLGPRALFGELWGVAQEVLIHNGTWNQYERYTDPDIDDTVWDSVSDTAVAAYIAYWNPNILDEVPWATAHAYMMKNTKGESVMDITTRGQWYEKEGNWYSNLNWEWTGRYNYHYMTGQYSTGHNSSTEYDPYLVKTESDEEREKWVNTWCQEYLKAESDERKKELDSEWNDYLRMRYGDDAVEEAKPQGSDWETCAEPDLEWTDAYYNDSDIVSEDFKTVNDAIERQYTAGLVRNYGKSDDGPTS